MMFYCPVQDMLGLYLHMYSHPYMLLHMILNTLVCLLWTFLITDKLTAVSILQDHIEFMVAFVKLLRVATTPTMYTAVLLILHPLSSLVTEYIPLSSVFIAALVLL